MSRQYLRAEDRYRIAIGQEPELSRDERITQKLMMQRKVLREVQKATKARQARQKAADATRQRLMDKHPEIKVWYWPEVK